MTINLFKIQNDIVDSFTYDLEEHGYEPVTDVEDNDYYMTLYLYKKSSKNEGWIDFYKSILSDEEYDNYSKDLGSETLAGVYLVEKGDCCYAVTHGYAHYIARKYCDKDFGLNLAERIIDPNGLKMKHSQTFTSNSKKDITSYNSKRKVGNSFDYGEAFSYLKCKTVNKKMWGETADFGESVRFTSSKNFIITVKNVFELVERVHNTLKTEVTIRLPRYKIVKDETTVKILKEELIKNFCDYLTKIDIEDYWMTGVSFNFSGEYKYALKYKGDELISICDMLDIETIKKAIIENQEKIDNRFELLQVQFYDENDEYQFNKRLMEMIQVTIDYKGKYYVLFEGKWVEFSESYVKYIEEQVDDITLEIKDNFGLSETGLIARLVESESYTQLHKNNIYLGKYCIEKADLMDENNVIMIKSQHNQPDLVYLIKQATTSLRLSDSGELGDNIFKGKNVCLWMLVKRKTLNKLSDFKTFHLLDALNDFKKAVTEKGLIPVVWVSLSR